MKSYAELLRRTDAPAGSTWGLFGADDEVGTLNLLTPERVQVAASLVRRGAVFNLDHRLDAFDPPLAHHRKAPRHVMLSNSPHHRDDYVDGLYLQVSSQIDGLRHFRHPEHGFYNGIDPSRIAADSPTLGINRYAERGIVGRGVVIDLERYLQRSGRRLDHVAGEAFGVALLDEVLAAQGVKLLGGDILLLRTGWLAWYFDEATPEQRAGLPGKLRCPGLAQSQDTLAWLWDHQVAVLASDNVGIEALPVVADTPFRTSLDGKPGTAPVHGGMMHPALIGLLGLALGELWDLEALAADCARDRVYECLVTAKPLNLTGGVGSPANALAVK